MSCEALAIETRKHIAAASVTPETCNPASDITDFGSMSPIMVIRRKSAVCVTSSQPRRRPMPLTGETLSKNGAQRNFQV